MKGTDFYKLISKRRSIRNYDPVKMVPEDVLERILNAGRLAPTSSNKQPATFRLIRDPGLLNRVNKCYPRSWFMDAPSILIITGKRQDAWIRQYDGFNSLEIDLAIMMDHMILAASCEGVATCWIIAFDKEVVKKELELSADDVILCMSPLGYPRDGFNKPQMPARKSLEELVRYY